MHEGRCSECDSTEVYRGRATVNGKPLVLEATTRSQKVFFEVDTYVCLDCRHLVLHVAEKADVAVLAEAADWRKVEA
jgi:hypothetical protein